MHHTVGELHTVQLRAPPLHAGIRGAFKEIHLVVARKPHQVLQGKNHRGVHQAVDHQAILGWVNLGHATMVAFKRQTIGCDDPIQLVQRREVDRGRVLGR